MPKLARTKITERRTENARDISQTFVPLISHIRLSLRLALPILGAP